MNRTFLPIFAVVAALVLAVVLIASASGGDPTLVAATTTPTTTESPSSTTGSVEVTEGPVTLPEQLSLSVGDWETDWTRRTIDLDELLLGIPASIPET